MADKVAEEPSVINKGEEKRIPHYSSYQEILLVGEGDFSFSLCLAHSFGSASNIVASSLQSYEEVIKTYKNGKSNLEKLKALGGTILHGVDATKLQHHTDISNRKFHRIIFNFPHAGFYGKEDNNHLIQMHQNLVAGFMGSAKERLRADGQIHVTHKTTEPFNLWDLVGLGSQNSLSCINCADFKIENYPGYNNKYGAGSKCDMSFPLRECTTFMFILNPTSKSMHKTKQNKQQKRKREYLHMPSQKIQKVSNSISPPIYPFQQQLSSIYSRTSPTYLNDMNGFPSYAGLPARHDHGSKCFRIFKRNFSYIQQTFGRKDIDVEVAVRKALQRASLMFRAENGWLPDPYLKILEELQFWKQSRFFRLEQMLLDIDRRLYELQGMGYYL
ncbi:uncharacterized protein At4g26485-like isoform X1 [Nicotiana tabacum]|uniref:Uncharacterized protein At4g26485-like isoform X1 n=1 Tax=Nicotiana tabacum TaxID=4097 RepID=A0A1S4BER2_TOBAC|nr:PREDICTED: uncharacterized protein At4g26485-like isoform X1 [Nicotiana tabacum]